MMKLTFRPVMILALVGACGGLAQGESGVPDKIRFAVGMDVNQFNAQPAVARQTMKLDPADTGVMVISEPHVLELEVNGHSVTFDGGGQNAFTYVKNGFARLDEQSQPGRLEFVSFDMNRELVTLDQAIALARKSCAAMRAAGLVPRGSSGRFGVVTDTLGSRDNLNLANEKDLADAFANADRRAIRAVFCDLEDENHVFSLQISNSRRAIHRYRGGGSEENALTERWYRVSGQFMQNLGREANEAEDLRLASGKSD